MTKSMTAYSQATINTELGELSCELRSVNHRYLEVAPRMPEQLRPFEADLRDLIGSKLTRGRVDCFIRLPENDVSVLQPNPDTVADLQALLEQMRSQLPSMQPIRAIDVLRWPGALQGVSADPDTLKQQMLSMLNDALDKMVAVRAQEGQKMAELIEQRLQAMSAVVEEVTGFLPELAQLYRDRLENKLADIRDQLEPARLEQEMVMFLQKNDVAEELDRLQVHIDEVRNVLAAAAPAGRRLDFLMQELNREANTLGSKAHDARLTNAAVDLKVLIEQVREQVQNIE